MKNAVIMEEEDRIAYKRKFQHERGKVEGFIEGRE